MSIPRFVLAARTAPPPWAFWERFLIDTTSRAAVEFVRRYTRADGTLVWRERWPGMDGSDDAYESFFNFPLLYALGGSCELDSLARFEWEAVTRQFTQYGQIYREFDAYYDWMHHGESSQLFYFFGLSDPTDLRMTARAQRFAHFYTGDDPEADNYDAERKLIRSPITGSRGPRLENSAEDWVTHRPVLADYPPPFDDVEGIVDGRADWNDDAIFAGILRLMNQRMMRGDVPLNLAATSLVTNAFLYSGDGHYRDWVTGYTAAWMERAAGNGGLLPDNVGPAGLVGELMDGKWWGGYYGWRWPHGWMNLADSATIASSNSLLLSGNRDFLALIRSQLDGIAEQGRIADGSIELPHRRGDAGWYAFRRPDPTHAIYLWYLSMASEDYDRVRRWQGQDDWTRVSPGRGKGDNTHAAPWFEFVNGGSADYPEQILKVNYAETCRRLEQARNDVGDPESWDVHHWQDLNPVVCEGLVQLMLGAPQPIYHGGLLHSRLRYFDPERRRPGVPPDVAALVHRIDADGLELELINLNPMEERRVLVQAGSFAEHRFTACQPVSPQPHPTSGESAPIRASYPVLEFVLAPAAGGRVRLGLDLYAATPAYRHPWHQGDLPTV